MKEQIELSLGSVAAPKNRARTRRREQADWWFHKMRSVVDRAFDWPAPNPSSRPRQPQLLLLGK